MLIQRWHIELFGGLRAQRGEQIVTHFPQKVAELLAYLALSMGRTHSRDELMELLWPEVEPSAGRNRLRQTLFSLRSVIEPPNTPAGSILITDRDAVRLNPTAVTVDVLVFKAAIESAAGAADPGAKKEALEQAVACYRDELLRGFYKDWILAEREQLAQAHLQALRQLMRLCAKVGEMEKAVEYGRRAVKADPLLEQSHYDLMRLYAIAGQPDAAQKQYQELERVLQAEFGRKPSAAVRALAEKLQVAGLALTQSSFEEDFVPTNPALFADSATSPSATAEREEQTAAAGVLIPPETEREREADNRTIRRRTSILQSRIGSVLLLTFLIVGLALSFRHITRRNRAAKPASHARLVPTLPEEHHPAGRSASPITGGIVYGAGQIGHEIEIWKMNLDGSHPTQLTFFEQASGHPLWSPDGTKIAFQCDYKGDREIYVMNGDGSKLEQLTRDFSESEGPCWSGDGKQIVFVHWLDGHLGFSDLYIMNADGSDLRRLTNNGDNNDFPSWCPDRSNRIAFTREHHGHWDIYIMNADGSHQCRLTNMRANCKRPYWSMDGRKIGFVCDTYQDDHWSLYVMNADGTGIKRLTYNTTYSEDNCPSWSPDGKKIAFASNRSGEYQIWVMNTDGSHVKRLTYHSKFAAHPSWYPLAGKRAL